MHKPNNKLVNVALKHFWCQEEPRANSDSQDSPRLGFGGSHHLPPLQYTLCLSTRPTSKWLFVLGLPSGNPEIAKIRIPANLEPHNLVCKPLIKMWFKAKFQPLLRSFQWYVARYLNTRKLGQFLTFSGWELNCQFDSRPFFWP